jgi:glucose-1-phosphate thymidylyltransferase
MKAVLLCAGQGTRLRPLTFCRPKHLLPVAGRAVLDRVLEDLASAGVDETIFVVGRECDPLQDFIAEGSRWGVSAGFCVQKEPLGLAHALQCARELVGADERFLMYLGDNLLGGGVGAFARDFAGGDAAASLVVKPVPDPRAFGVVVMQDGIVTRLVEKPQEPPSDLAIVGVYGFGPQIWQAIESIEPSDRGELEITDAINYLAQSGQRVDCHVMEDFWADAGSPEALLAANRFFLDRIERRIEGEVDGSSTVEGAVQIDAGAKVSASRIVGPCLIGPDTVVQRCSIGPHVSVGAGCSLSDLTVSDSIIDDASTVAQISGHLERSLLGRGVRIRQIGGSGPLSIYLADDSVITSQSG